MPLGCSVFDPFPPAQVSCPCLAGFPIPHLTSPVCFLQAQQASCQPATSRNSERSRAGGEKFNAYRIHISGDEEVRFDVVRNGAAREVAFQRGVRALDSGACPGTGDFFCTRSMQIRGEALIHLSGSYENLQDRYTMFFF